MVSLYSDSEEKKVLPFVICVFLFQRVGCVLTHEHRGNIDLLHDFHYSRKKKSIFIENFT